MLEVEPALLSCMWSLCPRMIPCSNSVKLLTALVWHASIAQERWSDMAQVVQD